MKRTHRKITLSLVAPLTLLNLLYAKDVVDLNTLTVTAQKQEENIQEVPISLTVLDRLSLEDKNIDDVWDIMDNIPGLMNFDTGMSDIFAQPSMRGITAPSTTFNSSVGLYIDGAPVFASPGFAANLIDIERVEVLRGPQGTLYGKNSEAGAINIITHKPNNELRGKIGTRIGEDNKKMFTGSVSGPIIEDQLYFGLAGQKDTKDGFLKNETLGGYDDDRDRLYGQGQLRWTPNDDLDVSFIMSRMSADEGVSPQAPNANMMAMYGQPALPDRTTYSDFRPHKDATNDFQTLKVDYQLSESMSISSITARKVTDWKAKGDYDFTPMPIYHLYVDNEYSTLSQEVRLNWKSEKIKGLVGLYADKHSNDIDTGNVMSDFSHLATTKRELSGDSYSIFGQVGYALSDDLHLTTGLRYETQNMDYDDELLNINTDKSWSKVTPKISLQYRFSPNVNTYATVAQGYRTGGFNFTATDLEYQSFDPEELWNYEIGVKTNLLDNRVQLNASLYYMDIQDMQVEESVTPITTYVNNATEATSKGIELEITAKATENLILSAGLSYNQTEFDSFSDSSGDYTGNKNPFAPEYTINLGASYRHHNGFFASANVIGYGSIYLDKANQYERDAYEVVNTKIGYEIEDFDFYLYADNLFDKNYDSLNYYGYYNNYSPPREVGIQLAYRF